MLIRVEDSYLLTYGLCKCEMEKESDVNWRIWCDDYNNDIFKETILDNLLIFIFSYFHIFFFK